MSVQYILRLTVSSSDTIFAVTSFSLECVFCTLVDISTKSQSPACFHDLIYKLKMFLLPALILKGHVGIYYFISLLLSCYSVIIFIFLVYYDLVIIFLVGYYLHLLGLLLSSWFVVIFIRVLLHKGLEPSCSIYN